MLLSQNIQQSWVSSNSIIIQGWTNIISSFIWWFYSYVMRIYPLFEAVIMLLIHHQFRFSERGSGFSSSPYQQILASNFDVNCRKSKFLFWISLMYQLSSLYSSFLCHLAECHWYIFHSKAWGKYITVLFSFMIYWFNKIRSCECGMNYFHFEKGRNHMFYVLFTNRCHIGDVRVGRWKEFGNKEKDLKENWLQIGQEKCTEKWHNFGSK